MIETFTTMVVTARSSTGGKVELVVGSAYFPFDVREEPPPALVRKLVEECERGGQIPYIGVTI